MSANNTFVVGQCTRMRDSVFMKARAQSVDGVMRDLTHTSQTDFPPDGEIELRGARAFLKPDDWVIAKPVLDGPPRRRRWISPTSRKLLPFEDLSALSGQADARRLLVETGLQDGFVGEKVYRIGTDEMIVVKMVKADDGRSRATSADMARLPVFKFDAARILGIPTPGGSISLIEKNHQLPEVRVANWMSDAEYVGQIIRAALSDGDQEQKTRAAIAATLVEHAGRLEALLSGAGNPDPAIVEEISRSKRLGEIMNSNPSMVADFMNALRRDPVVASRIKEEISRLTSDAVEAKRAALTADLTAALEVEFDGVRRERREKLKAELDDLEASGLQYLQEKIDGERNAALAGIEVRKTALELAVGDLERSRDALHAAHLSKQEEIGALEADAARLVAEVADRKSDIDRLLRMDQALQGKRDISADADGRPLFPLVEATPTAAPLALGDIQDWLKASHLLTEPGRWNVAKLAALVLSGAVPVVDGPEADEVLDILSSMLAGGAMTAFDCDPTVITFDDLWHRPGAGGAPTVLGEALSATRREPKARLCAIRRAELSPSGFWIEGLRRAGKQRAVPKEFLLCVTRSGDDGDSVKVPSAFRAEGWIDRNAGSHALASIVDETFERVADFSDLPSDPAAALRAMGSSQMKFSISEARWLARFVPVAKAILKGEAVAFVREVIDGASGDQKPALKLIDNGGSSRA
jgi:hypothetical protein